MAGNQVQQSFILLVVSGVLLSGCATNPATGKRQLMLMSEGQEVALGQQADKDATAAYGTYDDAELQRYVQELGAKMAGQSERPELHWSFRVVDDPIVNAFALPGGFIYVTRGIMAHLGSEAELMGVIGHEIGHVTARHSASQMSKAQLANLGLGIGAALKPELQGLGNLAGTSLGLLFLKFGRDAERQADDLGLRYMQRTRYDLREMPHVFETLDRVSRSSGGGRMPSWLATHPEPEERRQRILTAIASASDVQGTVNRDAYLRRLDGIVYGDDPRQGFFEGTAFYHPELRFQLEFPSHWTVINRRDAVEAINENKDAIVRLTLSSATSLNEATDSFARDSGVTTSATDRTRIGGFDAVVIDFQAQSQGGPVAGKATFIEYDRRVFQLIGYGAAATWSSNELVVERSMMSFDRLTDRARLHVEPQRIELVELKNDMSVTQFNERFPSTVPVAQVALLNQVDEGAQLKSGQLVKRVVGGTPR